MWSEDCEVAWVRAEKCKSSAVLHCFERIGIYILLILPSNYPIQYTNIKVVNETIQMNQVFLNFCSVAILFKTIKLILLLGMNLVLKLQASFVVFTAFPSL